MTTWEYKRIRENLEVMRVTNTLGAEGWEVFYLYDISNNHASVILRRRTDRYCEHCARATQVMDAMEKVTP